MRSDSRFTPCARERARERTALAAAAGIQAEVVEDLQQALLAQAGAAVEAGIVIVPEQGVGRMPRHLIVIFGGKRFQQGRSRIETPASGEPRHNDVHDERRRPIRTDDGQRFGQTLAGQSLAGGPKRLPASGGKEREDLTSRGHTRA